MRILSFNIHKGIGGQDRRYRLERILSVLDEEQPDIICLQEVDQNVKRSNFDDQPQLLAEHFAGFASSFQFNVPVKQGGYGNLILSRWPISSVEHVSLKLFYRKVRGAILAVIDTPEGRLHVATTHLGLGERQRQNQVRHLLQHESFKQNETLPTMIVGDCNDWLNKLEEAYFHQQGFTQVTKPLPAFRSFPAWLPSLSLDKAFVSNGISMKEARVPNTPMTRVASDHLPLVIDFEIR